MRAGTTHETARHMITESTLNIPEESAAQLPKYASLQRLIERKWKREQLPYPTPSSLAEIDIPDELRLTKRNENFLFFDSGPADLERIFIFATESNIQHLKNCQVLPLNTYRIKYK